MNYGPSHQPRYAPTLPNYAALAAIQQRGLVGAAGDVPAPIVPPPAKEQTAMEKIKTTLEEPNATVFNIPNKYLLGGAVALGLIGLGWKYGTFDKLTGGSKSARR